MGGDRAGVAHLERAAAEALERAHAPYSRFPVGAALEVDDGTVLTGCNLENASLKWSCFPAMGWGFNSCSVAGWPFIWS